MWDLSKKDYTNKTKKSAAYAKLLEVLKKIKTDTDVGDMKKKNQYPKIQLQKIEDSMR